MASREILVEQPLVVIVGPTASGKTALAVRLAKSYGGEVISADSRAIYRGLSIGTAKPGEEEREGIPHWGIDIVDPNERFTAADFQRYALRKISEIRARGKVPILAGGTGLYIDSVVYDFSFLPINEDVAGRGDMMYKSIQELHAYCTENNITLPENKLNKRYVVSAILRNGAHPKRKNELDGNTIFVGITTENEKLRARIEARAETIFTDGVVTEAQNIAQVYGWESEAMTGNVYPLIREYLTGKLTEFEMKQQFATKDWRLAKRQLTWLKRNKDIYWGDPELLYTYVARRLDEVNNL